MIAVACALCHVAVMASDDAATRVPSDGTDKPDIATHSEIRTELGKPEDHSRVDWGVGQTKDPDEKFESRLPGVDEQLSLEQKLDDRTGRP